MPYDLSVHILARPEGLEAANHRVVLVQCRLPANTGLEY